MRHLLSLLLGLVLAPLIYVSAGFSAVKFSDVNDQGNIALLSAVLGLVAGLIAGALYALLVMARLSPFGPVLAGLIYLGVTVWALVDLHGLQTTLPSSVFGINNLLIKPAGFGTALLAVPLLFTIFSPRRWRRSAQPAVVGGYQPAPMTYPTSGLATPNPLAVPATEPTPGAPYTPPASTATTWEPPVYTPTYPSSSSAAPTGYAPPSQTTEYAAPAYLSPNQSSRGSASGATPASAWDPTPTNEDN
jgi:hypothetical protein